MDEDYRFKRKKTFRSLFFLYFMVYFCSGILPVNIDNLLISLPGATTLGIGITVASTLIIGTMSIFVFGYFGDKITEKYSRKRIFMYTNVLWITAYGLSSLSFNYIFYSTCLIVGAIGTGAFLPIGFSIIGDFFPPQERGNKFGTMQFGLILGNGMGIIFGGLLGSYIGINGWRYAYALGFILGITTILMYIFTGIDPETGRAEPEFMDFEGKIDYDYKLTIDNLKELLKKKTIIGILLTVLCTGIAGSTLGTWGIFYLSSKLEGNDAGLIATTIYILAGAGSLPGAIIGGKVGDSYFRSGKIKGRVLISVIGNALGPIFLMVFYLTPFFTENPLQIIISWFFFLIIGYTGYMFSSFPVGNQFAIYSEVSTPELRSTANAMNGLMVNIGGIIGNLLISSLIEKNISLLPFALSIVLFLWLIGALFWIIPYFTYPKESKMCREILLERRKELEKK